jgi:hypothetical protein
MDKCKSCNHIHHSKDNCTHLDIYLDGDDCTTCYHSCHCNEVCNQGIIGEEKIVELDTQPIQYIRIKETGFCECQVCNCKVKRCNCDYEIDNSKRRSCDIL